MPLHFTAERKMTASRCYSEMVLFLQALQICAIASVFIKVHGYVFLAANIEDFKSIASRFLPGDIAKKLMDLVVQSSLSNRAIGRQLGENNTPETSISKLTDILGGNRNDTYNIAPYNSREQTSTSHVNKRYKTVDNADNNDRKTFKNIQSQPELNIKPADSARIKEEYENRMKQYIEDYTYNDYSKKNDKESNSTFTFDKFREDKGEEKARENVIENTNKRYDYTETKLGEWKFNNQAHQKPINIKNVKTGYTDIVVNSEMVKDVIKTHPIDDKYKDNVENNEDLSDIHEQGIGKDRYKADEYDIREIINHKLYDSHQLESKSVMITKNIDKNMYVKKTRESENKDSRLIKHKDRVVIQRDKYNNNVLESQKKGTITTTEQRKKNFKQAEHALYSKTKDSDERNIARHKDNLIRKPPKQSLINKHISHEPNEEDSKTDIEENLQNGQNYSNESNKYDKKTKLKKNEDTNERRRRKKLSTAIYGKYILGSATEDSEEPTLSAPKASYETKHKIQPIGENNMQGKHGSKSKYIEKITKEREDRKRKKYKKPIEQNDMYDKFMLGSNAEVSDEDQASKHRVVYNKKPQRQAEVNNNNEKHEPGKTKEENAQHEPDNDDGFGNDHSVPKNKEPYPFEPPFGKEYEKGKDNVNEVTTEVSNTASPGFVDDPPPDFKEVKAEGIKAKTESLIDDDDESFIMNGTDIPTRITFKMTSPDYFKTLPRIVDKYDFNEPLPEKDRLREEKKYITREPSLVNKRIKLPVFDSA